MKNNLMSNSINITFQRRKKSIRNKPKKLLEFQNIRMENNTLVFKGLNPGQSFFIFLDYDLTLTDKLLSTRPLFSFNKNCIFQFRLMVKDFSVQNRENILQCPGRESKMPKSKLVQFSEVLLLAQFQTVRYSDNV